MSTRKKNNLSAGWALVVHCARTMRGLANNRAACSSIFYWAMFSGRIAGPTTCDNDLHHDSISFGDNPDVK